MLIRAAPAGGHIGAGNAFLGGSGLHITAALTAGAVLQMIASAADGQPFLVQGRIRLLFLRQGGKVFLYQCIQGLFLQYIPQQAFFAYTPAGKGTFTGGHISAG